ncbi:MAG: tRNA (N6-threonylcarbamoyladenosine(37)-N6)-methyltransferase TrmO [Thermoleophilia bacterium]|jgi:tRNA-Thr(GGU) m(6)t(6)A37 methyltransferase TsaA|nr:tRNA (N6-threonylcarbamoyladenosine(37)-N6)-methyltransferase TrmO [Thermoleophilia bacterium]
MASGTDPKTGAAPAAGAAPALSLTPIGVIHSPHRDPGATPIQPACAEGCRGEVEVFEPYAAGLDDVDGFSHVHLLYWLHLSGPPALRVTPFLDDTPRGVFATRAPNRPNPLGLSVVRVLERRDRILVVDDLDVLDGTPLLDIKPYVERFDVRAPTRGGWTERVDGETFRRRGARGGTGAPAAGDGATGERS